MTSDSDAHGEETSPRECVYEKGGNKAIINVNKSESAKVIMMSDRLPSREGRGVNMEVSE